MKKIILSLLFLCLSFSAMLGMSTHLCLGCFTNINQSCLNQTEAEAEAMSCHTEAKTEKKSCCETSNSQGSGESCESCSNIKTVANEKYSETVNKSKLEISNTTLYTYSKDILQIDSPDVHYLSNIFSPPPSSIILLQSVKLLC